MTKKHDKPMVGEAPAKQDAPPAVMALPRVAHLLAGAIPKKIIVVPDRLVNIVV